MDYKEPSFLQRNKTKTILLLIIAFALIVVIGGIYYATSPTDTNKPAPSKGDKPAAVTDPNKISNDEIVLSSGVKISLPKKKGSSSSSGGTVSTGISGQGSGSSGQGGIQGGTQGSTQGETPIPGDLEPTTPVTPNPGDPDPVTPIPGDPDPIQTEPTPNQGVGTVVVEDGVFAMDVDGSFANQVVTVAKSNVKLAKFVLVNEKAEAITLKELFLDFAFTDDFSRSDLSNLKISINGQAYPTKSSIGTGGVSWNLSQSLPSSKQWSVEVSGDIAASAAGGNTIDDEAIAIVKIRGEYKGKTVYSGPGEKDQYMPGQFVTAVGSSTPTPPPPPPVNPPVPPVTPPAATTGSLIIAYGSQNGSDHMVLTGSVEDVLFMDVTAEDEDIYLTNVKFEYDGLFAEVKDFELYIAEDSTSLYSQIGNTKQVPNSREVEWIWKVADPNIIKLAKGKTASLKLRVKYEITNGAHSLSGTNLNFTLKKLNGKGVTSIQAITGATNNIKSKTTMLVETKPKITMLSSGGNISGGTQEILKFKVEPVLNTNDGAINRVYLYHIDVYTPAISNASVKKLTIEPSGIAYNANNVSNCVGLKKYQWRCDFSTNQSTNEVLEGISSEYVVKAEVGLSGNGSFNVKATPFGSNDYFGSFNATGAVRWSDQALASNYFYWVDDSSNMTLNWSGSGNGSLYDNTGPKIVSYQVDNGGVSGTIDSGDIITITFDELIDPTSIHQSLLAGGNWINVSSGQTGSFTAGRTANANKFDIFGMGVFNQNGSSNVSNFSTKIFLNHFNQLKIKLNSGTAQLLQMPFVTDDGNVSSNSITDMNGNKMPEVVIPYSSSANF